MRPQQKGKPGYLMMAVFIIAGICGMTGNVRAQEKEEVAYRLKWLFNASVVGDLWADVNGNFGKNGLKVAVKAGGPERDAIKELELGRAQFGVASADQVIRAVSMGAPIVVLAQLFQINPLHWIYRPDKSPFKDPTDFKGRVVGVTYGGNDETIMRALLAKYNITESELNLYSVRYDYTPFYQGKVDFWPLYINAQAPIIGDKLKKAGEQYSFVGPADFGIQFVANSVVTSEKMMESRPDTVKRFITALLQGWRDALDPANKEKAIKTVLQFDKETPEDLVRQQLPVTRKLMLPEPDSEFGKIDVAAWKQTEQIMLAQKLIEAPVNIETLLKPVVD
jgi:NitT/TauT family transport system substrate-binding protein